MATRPIWRGHLRLALVSCPIALHSVIRASGELHFHFINPKTGNRVRSVLQDAETDEEVSRRDLTKGYEFEKDRYVLMDDEDFEKAKIESSSTVSVDKFVPLESIDPVYFDTSYYVVPDGDAGLDVFAVLRTAIAGTGQAALARVVIARRERAVAIRPMGKGLVCHTLHEPREINDARPLFDPIPDGKPDAEMVKLATQLIERQEGRFEPTDSEDHYEARLREVIAAKLKGEGITPEETKTPARDNVIDLMAALKASLGRGGEKRGGDQAAEKPAPARKAAAASNKAPAKRGGPTRKRA
ncbi:MAG TPA: Ku protein [Acetobacteraceae bacterium]|jgi:DNA end-binding protein Ku|nr:Ku protein [Acetobacteraceae bacterium]